MNKPALSILLIDDDHDDQEIFIEALKEVDPSVHCYTAVHYEDAVKTLNDLAILPDWIFLDLNLPRVDGNQCLVELKKIKEWRHIPVVVYTTSSLSRDKQQAKELGADYFLTKQYSFSALCQSLKEIFQGVGSLKIK